MGLSQAAGMLVAGRNAGDQALLAAGTLSCCETLEVGFSARVGRWRGEMKLLLIHNEARYFGGAETTLGYYLSRCGNVAVAVAPGSRVEALTPASCTRIRISDNAQFGPWRLLRQVWALRRWHQSSPFDLIHGWAARDWELAGLLSWFTSVPAIGTLHDHPSAQYISGSRRWLMKLSARVVLARVVAVSDAVMEACRTDGYPSERVSVIRNGIPATPPAVRDKGSPVCRIGYLGAFTVEKGFDGLLETVDLFSGIVGNGWEVWVGGGCVSAASETLREQMENRYRGRSWWSKVKWKGWIKDPRDFMEAIDVLLFPSRAFDSLPTVLLEAGWAGCPAVAAAVGGAAEVVQHGVTGWLFGAGSWQSAAHCLREAVADRDCRLRFGQAGRRRAEEEFSVDNMVANYGRLYSTLARHV